MSSKLTFEDFEILIIFIISMDKYSKIWNSFSQEHFSIIIECLLIDVLEETTNSISFYVSLKDKFQTFKTWPVTKFEKQFSFQNQSNLHHSSKQNISLHFNLGYVIAVPSSVVTLMFTHYMWNGCSSKIVELRHIG